MIARAPPQTPQGKGTNSENISESQASVNPSCSSGQSPSTTDVKPEQKSYASKGPAEEKGTSKVPVMAGATAFVKVKFPPYTVGQQRGIQTWLKQVDICLRLANIKEEKEKYEHLVAAPSNRNCRPYLRFDYQ